MSLLHWLAGDRCSLRALSLVMKTVSRKGAEAEQKANWGGGCVGSPIVIDVATRRADCLRPVLTRYACWQVQMSCLLHVPIGGRGAAVAPLIVWPE